VGHIVITRAIVRGVPFMKPMWRKLTNAGANKMHDSLYQAKYGDKLHIATINIPDNYLQCIEDTVNIGLFPSRSECCREIIKRFLIKMKSQTIQVSDFKNIIRKKYGLEGF